jgi:hypothetical protein
MSSAGSTLKGEAAETEAMLADARVLEELRVRNYLSKPGDDPGSDLTLGAHCNMRAGLLAVASHLARLRVMCLLELRQTVIHYAQNVSGFLWQRTQSVRQS